MFEMLPLILVGCALCAGIVRLVEVMPDSERDEKLHEWALELVRENKALDVEHAMYLIRGHFDHRYQEVETQS